MKRLSFAQNAVLNSSGAIKRALQHALRANRHRVMQQSRYTPLMTVGELFLGSFTSGVITPAEIDWLLTRHDCCTREEQATLQRLGRLLDDGSIHLGCRLAP